MSLENRLRILTEEYYRSLPTRLDRLGLSYASGISGLLAFSVWVESNLLPHSRALVSRRIKDHLVDRLSKTDLSFGLHSGLCGVLYSLELYERYMGGEIPGLNDVRKTLEDSITSGRVNRALTDDGFDLIKGMAGTSLYFSTLTQKPSFDATRALIELLYATSQKKYLTDVWESTNPDGERSLDLGLSHGQPGVMAALLGAERLGAHVGSEKAQQILQLLASCRTHAGLPYKSDSTVPSRIAWCYGELGIVVAQVSLGNPNSTEKGLLIAMLDDICKRIRAGDHGIRDGFFCHGSSGIALIFSDLRRRGFYSDETVEQNLVTESAARIIESCSSPHHPTKNNHTSLLDGLPGAMIATLWAASDGCTTNEVFGPMLIPASIEALQESITSEPGR